MKTYEKKEKKIREDINFSKYQIFLPSKNKSKNKNKIIETKHGSIEIISLGEYGTLQVFDYKILLALTNIWDAKGRHDFTSFKISEISNILRLKKSGKRYEQIKNSLIRLSSVPIVWTKSYFDKEQNENCQLIEKYTILEKLRIKKIDEHSGEMFFQFNDYMLRNFKSNYTKPIYLTTILSFKLDLSIVLFRYVDYVLFKYPNHEISLVNLIKYLGLSEYNYKSKRLEKIQKALDEVDGVYLTSGEKLNVSLFDTKDKKDYKIMFSKEKIECNEKKEVLEGLFTDKEIDLLRDLFNQKVHHLGDRISSQSMLNLLQTYKPEKENIFSLLQDIVFDPKSSYKPFQTLIAALKGTYIVPDKEELRDSKNKEEEKKRIEKEQERKQREKAEKERENEKKYDLIFRKLPPEKQESLKQKAFDILKTEHPNSVSDKLLEPLIIFKVREIIKQEQLFN